MDTTVERSLTEAYGITGFPLYRVDERDRALRDYDTLLREVKV